MFQIDMKSSKSVYEQVIDKIKELVMMGVLEEGSRLPSVRELSKQLTINPNTVQKAFKELERDGYIFTVTGKGTFVSARDEIKADDDQIQAALGRIRDEFRSLSYLGIDPDKAAELATGEIQKEVEILKKG